MTATEAFLTAARREFHRLLQEQIFFRNAEGVLSNADKASKSSVRLAEGIAVRLGASTKRAEHLKGQEAGMLFESLCRDFVASTFLRLTHLRPGRWEIAKLRVKDEPVRNGKRPTKIDIARYEQYSHLRKLAAIAAKDRELAAVLQTDYLITPDVVIARMPEPDDVLNAPQLLVDGASALLASLREQNNTLPILHASISCKWTLRSDRGQNVRTEGLNLVKNRKGHLPHVVFVTGEPMPARIASIAMGTGEVDCVYHFALPELRSAAHDLKLDDAEEALAIMVEGNRLKDISDLPLDLAV